MRLNILYGSQTGTSEEVAFDLARECSKRLIPVRITSLDTFDPQSLLTLKLAVFIVSTTGQGEPPDNMKHFWKIILNKNLLSNTLSQLNFSVFGLGDSTYDHYNVVARKLFIRLKQIGARAFINKGLGDDMHDFGYESEFHPWCNNLWEGLKEFFPLLEQITPSEGLLPPMYCIERVNGEVAEHSGQFEGKSKLKVISNDLVSEKFTYTRNIVVEHLDFAPGDTLAVNAPNEESVVLGLMQRMGWEDGLLKISLNTKHPFAAFSRFPSIISLKTLLTWHVDLHKPVSRYFISVLTYFASGLHKEKLAEMSSKTLEGRNEYHRYVTKECRSAFEVLWDFSSIETIPLEYFLEAIQEMRPREFSIASNTGNIELLVSVVKFLTPLGREIKGLCTNYLNDIGKGQDIWAQVKKGRMPTPPLDMPVIFIATGTGLAPLKSILFDRISKNSYENLLFFGTRHPDHDYYYKGELESLQESQKLKAFVCFSQISQKKYVHQLIQENWRDVVEFINHGAFILICGKHKMILKNTKTALVQCFSNIYSIAEAEIIVKNIEKNNKIYLENW